MLFNDAVSMFTTIHDFALKQALSIRLQSAGKSANSAINTVMYAINLVCVYTVCIGYTKSSTQCFGS
jgi:hypothetical protein